MKNLRKNWVLIILSLIFILSIIIRFYKIDQIPVSLYWDETASTYNAYSISQTGRDEYGNSLPLLFRSFDDYKMSGNIYLTALIVKFFGLNEFSARASSAFLGSLTVLLTFFLIKELLSLNSSLFLNLGKFKIDYSKKSIPLLATFLFAISPWHIQFSRTGFEANVGLFFIVLGALLLLKSVKNFRYFIFSMLVFGISFYFYRSIHLFVPFLLLGFFIILRRELVKKEKIKFFVISILLLIVISLPILFESFSSSGMARLRQVNVFTNSEEKIYPYAILSLESGNSFISRLIYNRRLIYAKEITGNYLSHFSPNFLFISGDSNVRHGPRGMGLLYLWELPFFILGLIVIFLFPKNIRNIILIWLLISPLPATFSVPSPHALRSLNMLPMPSLLTTLGIFTALVFLDKSKKIIFAGGLIILGTLFFIKYLYLYFVFTPNIASSDWADGYKELSQYVFAKESSYDKVIITGHYWEPYIYFLFYKKYDPYFYQRYGSSKGFDKYIFGGTSWDRDKNYQELGEVDLKKMANSNNILVALSPEEYQSQRDNIKKLTDIKDHNNDLVFIVGEVK